MTSEQAKENLERELLWQQRQSRRRGYRGPSLGTEKKIAELQLRSEGVDFDEFETIKEGDIAINERIKANRKARGPMAFDTAQGRLVPMNKGEKPSAPPLEPENLRFPTTEGGELGMDRGRLEQAAMNEAMRLGGGQITDESREQVIMTPYGVMSSRGEFSPTEGSERMTQADFEESAGGFQGFDRPERYTKTPSGDFQRQFSGKEDRELAIGKAAEAGSIARANLSDKGRQKMLERRAQRAEQKAQEAMIPFGNQPPTEGQKRRAQQYLAEAADFREQAAGRRKPMSKAPLTVPTPRSFAIAAPTTPLASMGFGGTSGSQFGRIVFDSFDSSFGEFNFTDPLGLSRQLGTGGSFF